MFNPTYREVLSKHAFAKNFRGEHLDKLAEGALPFRANPGDFLGQEHDTAQAFYLIQSGHVEIGTNLNERGSVPIQRVGPDEVVGWSWLLPPYRWEFDARAVNSVEGLVFDAGWLRKLCETDHDLGYQLLKQLVVVVSRRLKSLRMQHATGHR